MPFENSIPNSRAAGSTARLRLASHALSVASASVSCTRSGRSLRLRSMSALATAFSSAAFGSAKV